MNVVKHVAPVAPTNRIEPVGVEVLASTFDKEPPSHLRMTETLLDRAKRLVETGPDVVVLLDSVTRLARACNMLAPAGAKIMTGGIAAGALDWPKRFFGAARQLEACASLMVLATAITDGSRRAVGRRRHLSTAVDRPTSQTGPDLLVAVAGVVGFGSTC